MVQVGCITAWYQVATEVAADERQDGLILMDGIGLSVNVSPPSFLSAPFPPMGDPVLSPLSKYAFSCLNILIWNRAKSSSPLKYCNAFLTGRGSPPPNAHREPFSSVSTRSSKRVRSICIAIVLCLVQHLCSANGTQSAGSTCHSFHVPWIRTDARCIWPAESPAGCKPQMHDRAENHSC